MSISGQHIIQQSTLLRGQGYYREAIATIEENIGNVSEELHSTAWHEAEFSAEAMGSEGLMALFAERALKADCDIEDFSCFQRKPLAQTSSSLYSVA